MNLDELNNLDPANIGNWPILAKTIVVAVLFGGALFAGYYFDTQNQIAQLQQVKDKENTLRRTFEEKQLSAARLPQLKAQLAEIEASLADLQRSLPSKADVGDLIQNISQAAIGSGLRVQLFEPRPEVTGEIYVTQPITLRLSGDYHAFGRFVSNVAAMPRIVTQEEISISAPRNVAAGVAQNITMEMVAKIYYIREEEEEDKGV
ncbi:type 4a pilus biogenesis protein PilO [Thioflexithrix psekupsensis]|uniref:Pilus assembly protein PilO n=1 Tax=Thioflexithrix psekupsensis TaxID=1570016 RepID=A0A251X459_9GAMM|nr:type 4a pilus biogenesis protein PilO [Thioflexithrix psekupsensis]OUD12145.1 hypothetical protein TPSD3_13540 [Thioflexithrix psekupsensis]